MKIAVLGSTGMLGNAVGHHFVDKYGEENVFTSYRNIEMAYGNIFLFDPFKVYFATSLQQIPHVDYIINCLGVIKPFITNNIEESIFINSIFPRKLADYCNKNDIRLIHITSDCVYQGTKGNYIETDPHDCTDIYGKTKSLGEPNNCMILRTSIIGEELHKKASLIEWLKSQKNGKVRGFTNHYWNGVTTRQYAKICQTIIESDLYEQSLFHVFSDTVTKEQLLRMIDYRFKLNTEITPCEADEQIDRTLSTMKILNKTLQIPSLNEQIQQL